MFNFFKKKIITLKPTPNFLKVWYQETGNVEKVEKVIQEGYFLIRFLTHEDKVMEFKQKYFSPKFTPTEKYIENLRYTRSCGYIKFNRVNDNYFELIDKDGRWSQNFPTRFSECLHVSYPIHGYGNNLDYQVLCPEPIEFIPMVNQLSVDGVLYNVKAYISNTFIETSRRTEVFELKEYEVKYE